MPDLQSTTMTSASKVGDLFSAAGEAFTKLAELTHILQTAAKNDSHLSSNENSHSEAQWLDSDTESLQMAVKRFGDDLNVISEHIKDKTMYQIKTTFRKIQPTLSNATTPNEKTGTETSPSVSAATFGGHDSSNSYTTDNAVASSSALSSMVSPPVTAKAAASTQNATSSNAAIASNSFPRTSSASGVNPGAATAASSCSSPSPFLHYPLLRKSADITLNMLNARDDSDDDERVSMSVFNSV